MTLAATAGLALAATGTALTSSNTAPSSTAGYNSVSVTGATMKSIGYDVAAGAITGFTVRLKGPQVYLTTTLFSTVSARFGAGTSRPCVIGVYDAVNDQTPAVCTGFAQPAAGSWTLSVTVS